MPDSPERKPFKISRQVLRDHAAPHSLKIPKAKSVSLRIVIWFVQIVVVLAVIEHFFIRPHLSKKIPSIPAAQHGELIPALGEDAKLPVSLKEVSPAWLPLLNTLPEEAVGAIQRQLDSSSRNGLPVESVNSIGMRFRLIPPGDCQIGSPENEPGHTAVEQRHLVSFSAPFYMGMYEVTQAQWGAVMGKDSNPSHFTGGSLPVEEVTWTQCQAFCKKLAEIEGLPKNSYRLPSEAEWEYACRAGSQTAYCFGNDVRLLDKWADYDGNNYKRTSPVGQKLPNAFGLYDMHGNVWEWCRDLYKNYPGDSTPYSEAHTYRCVRGGNWFVSAQECRSANRCRLPDQSTGNMLGFRVMLVLEN
ncbi:MAG: formylglycine-generating enzyme family protein [Victivallales bacterium]|nr:formylglycine-generating enzyme family protein [Victivallales bacterium]